MEYFPRNWLRLGHLTSCCSILVGLLLVIPVFSSFFCSPTFFLSLPLLQVCLCWRKAAPLDTVGQFPALPTLSIVCSPGFPASLSMCFFKEPWSSKCLMNRLNKQVGKRHINSVYPVTSQCGSKGNWRFSRKLSRVRPGSPRQHHIEESWHLAQAINDQTEKTPKVGWELHCKLLSSWVQLREKFSFRAKHKLQDVFTTNFPNFLLEGHGSQMDLLWISLTNPPQLQILYQVIFT